MKLTYLIVFFFPVFLCAQVQSPAEFLSSVKGTSKPSPAVVEKGFIVLKKATSAKKLNETKINSILQLALFQIKHEPSNYTAELIFPVYSANKTVCLTIIQNWSMSDINLIMNAITFYKRSITKGNG